MTYKWRPLKEIGLSWFNPSHSGALALNDYITLTAGDTNSLSITGTGTTTLTLPPGRYHLRGTLGGQKVSAPYIEYQWEISGSLEGNVGIWDTSSQRKITCEYAEAVIDAETDTDIRLKCVGVSGSCSLTSNLSGIMIRGTQ